MNNQANDSVLIHGRAKIKKAALLKKYILDPEILIMPGAHDALSARIIEKTGFKAAVVGGYSATAALPLFGR